MIDKVLLNLLENGDYKKSEVAKALGVSTQTLYGWTKGLSVPPLDYLSPIVNYFHLDIDTLRRNDNFSPIDYQVSDFSRQFTAYRASLDIPLSELSAKLGVTRQTLSKWEKGESYPNIDAFYTFSEKIGLVPSLFFTATSFQSSGKKKRSAFSSFILKNIVAVSIVSAVALVAAVAIPLSISMLNMQGNQNNVDNSGFPDENYVPKDDIDNPDEIPEFADNIGGLTPNFSDSVQFNALKMNAFVSEGLKDYGQEGKLPLLGHGYIDGQLADSYFRNPYGRKELYEYSDYVRIRISIEDLPGEQEFYVPMNSTFEYKFRGKTPTHYKIRTASTSFVTCDGPLVLSHLKDHTIIRITKEDLSEPGFYDMGDKVMCLDNLYVRDAIPNYDLEGKYIYGWESTKNKRMQPIIGDAPISLVLDLDGGSLNGGTIPSDFDCRKINDLPVAYKNGYRFIGYSYDGNIINGRSSLAPSCTLKAEYKQLDYSIYIDGELYGRYYEGEEVYLPPKFFESSFVDHYTTLDDAIVESTFYMTKDLNLKSYEISYEDYFGSIRVETFDDIVLYLAISNRLRTLIIPDSMYDRKKFNLSEGFDDGFVDTIVIGENLRVESSASNRSISGLFSKSDNYIGKRGATNYTRFEAVIINNNASDPLSKNLLYADYMKIMNPHSNSLNINTDEIVINKLFIQGDSEFDKGGKYIRKLERF